jgi:LysR family cys regulon transcriptional activator
VKLFRQRYPQVKLELHQGTSEQIADMVNDKTIDLAIATGSQSLFSELLLLPVYQWDRTILVPEQHELTRLNRKLTLQDLAKHPLVTYVFSFGGESSLKKAFLEQGLNPDVVFTARDADVIKTYVRLGLGVGIVASMAHECDADQDLTAIDAEGLFPRSTTWIGFRKDAILRRYMQDFIQFFAPHISTDQIVAASQSQIQADVDSLFRDTRLPVRGGCSGDTSAAD